MGISYRERMLAELKNRVVETPVIVPAKETIVELEDKVEETKVPKVKQTKAKKK
jgi:hypothetical protein